MAEGIHEREGRDDARFAGALSASLTARCRAHAKSLI